MADRVNIKVDKEVRDQLKQHKRPRETWNQFFVRAIEALQGGSNPSIFKADPDAQTPTCLGCGDPTEMWQIQISGVLCPGCANLDVAVECG